MNTMFGPVPIFPTFRKKFIWQISVSKSRDLAFFKLHFSEQMIPAGYYARAVSTIQYRYRDYLEPGENGTDP